MWEDAVHSREYENGEQHCTIAHLVTSRYLPDIVPPHYLLFFNVSLHVNQYDYLASHLEPFIT
jgi:hypothetical protein